MEQSRRRQRQQRQQQQKLTRLIDDLIDRGVFRTRRDVAAACGMTDAGLCQVMTNPRRRLTVEQCLRLARVLHMPPVTLLQLADRRDMAGILDDLWPRKRDHMALTKHEREVIDTWRTMPTSEQFHFIGLIRIYAALEHALTAGPHGSAPAVRRAWPPPRRTASRLSRRPAG